MSPGELENRSTARSSPARVAGYEALTIGLMNFSSNSSIERASCSNPPVGTTHALAFVTSLPIEEDWWTGRDLNPRPFGHSRSIGIYANRTFFSPRLDGTWYTRLNYRPSRIAPRPIEVLRLWRNSRGWMAWKNVNTRLRLGRSTRGARSSARLTESQQ